MAEFETGDYVIAVRDIKYEPVYAGKNDVKKGDLGKIHRVLLNVQIQAVKLFCQDKDFTDEELGTGFSTFLAINWLTGEQKGKCLRTHKSNVKKISEAEARYILKIKR